MTKSCDIPSLDTPDKGLSVLLDGDLYLSTWDMREETLEISCSVRLHNDINGGGPHGRNGALYQSSLEALKRYRKNGGDLFQSPRLDIAANVNDMRVVRFVASGPDATMPVKCDIVTTPRFVGINIWDDFDGNKPCLDNIVWLAKTNAGLMPPLRNMTVPDTRQALFGDLFFNAFAGHMPDPFQTFQTPQKGTAHALDY